MEESFGIRPEENFYLDIVDLLNGLDKLDTAVRYPKPITFFKKKLSDCVYTICGNKDQATRVKKRIMREQSLESFHGSIAFIEPTPEYIFVISTAPRSVLKHLSPLLIPILKNQSCRIFVERGEITEQYANCPEKLFE